MEDIFKTAISYGESEFAWKEEDIPAVINVLTKQNNAIIGAEVWIATKDKRIKELYWFDFGINDKLDSESWNDYVIQTSNEFLLSFIAIKGNKRIEEEKVAEDGEVYFNISFVSEDEYQDLISSL